MEIVCPGCSRHYKIADDKLPASGTAYLTCPECQQRICLKAPGRTTEPSAKEEMAPTEGLEFFPPGAQTALVYCPEIQAKTELEQRLGGLGFEVRHIEGRRDLAARLRYHIYDLIVLYQRGADLEDPLQEILGHIHGLPMHIRRQTFVLYIQIAGNQYDTLIGFLMSVDLTSTPLDLSQLGKILPRALEAKQAQYKTFLECRARIEEDLT